MDEYIKQNTSGLFMDIQKVGCFFRAACHMAEVQAKKENKIKYKLSIADINLLWSYAKRIKYITPENNLIKSEGVANLAAQRLGLKGRFVEVATFEKGIMGWYISVPQSKRRADYYIQKIAQGGPSKTHFINVNKYGDVEWDPHLPEIKSLGAYYTICYRYDQEEKK